MPVICFEGASAVGKTTTADNLGIKYGAFVVPEVNLLFVRPENESAEWYFERQVDRWLIAQEEIKTHQLVILDGDAFQPLWYNWAYNFEGWQKFDFLKQFYQPRIENKTISFPDLYFVFNADETELRKRQQTDANRSRRNFEKHLQMIKPQRRYFQAMQNFSPSKVCFLEAESIEKNIEIILDRISVLPPPDTSESEILFSRMVQWLRENKA